jgi:hypothetical protein
MTGPETPGDRFIEPGTRVRRDALMNGEQYSEWGTVLECWWEDEIGAYDCRIAFDTNTSDEPDPNPPLVFRYAAVGLEIVDAADKPARN